MDEPATRTTLEKGLVSSLVLIGLTALSYALAYRYEQGFLSHFGAPGELISIDLTRFVWVLVALLFIAYLWHAALSVGFVILMKDPSSYLRLIVGTVVSAGAVAAIYALMGATTAMVVTIALIVSVLLFIVLILVRRVALKHQMTFDSSLWDEARDVIINPTKRPNYTILFWVIIFTISSSSGFGGRVAGHVETFYVRSGSTEHVLIRTYGNSSLWAEFDRENNVIRQSFLVIPMDRDTVSFRRERLGRLTVADPYEAE